MSLHTCQRFRRNGCEKNVPLTFIDDESFVLLKDIQDTFVCPISILTLNDQQLTFVCDAEQNTLVPLRIQAIVDKIIDCDDPDCHTTMQRIDLTTRKTLYNTELLIVKANTILRQTFELAEYNIPRLFVILPDEQGKLKSINLFQHSYRLFFLCECENENERHLALHEGYKIKRASEFIQKYGSYLKNMLTVFKYAVSVSTILIPQLSQLAPHLNIPNALQNERFYNSFSEKLEKMTDTLEKVMEENIGEKYIDERLEGSDLREIEFFLEKSDTRRTLGNLYRSPSSDGRIRWVCIHHYRQIYGDIKIKDLRKEFRTLDGDVRFDSALMTKKNEKNLDQLLDVIGRGLRLFKLKLSKCHMNKSTFNNLLNIAGDRSQIQYLELDRISVYKSLGVKKEHLKIISKLEKIVQSFTQLSISYTVKCPYDRSKPTSVDKDLFDYSMKQTNSRLILNVYTLDNGKKINLNKFSESDRLYLMKTVNQNKMITHFEMSCMNKELTASLMEKHISYSTNFTISRI